MCGEFHAIRGVCPICRNSAPHRVGPCCFAARPNGAQLHGAISSRRQSHRRFRPHAPFLRERQSEKIVAATFAKILRRPLAVVICYLLTAAFPCTQTSASNAPRGTNTASAWAVKRAENR